MAGLFKGTTLFYICGHTVVTVPHMETRTPVYTRMHTREHAPRTELRHQESVHTHCIGSRRGLEVMPRTDSYPVILYTRTPETTHIMQAKDKPLRGLEGLAARGLLDGRA